jgi:hypothetical protein
MSEDNEPDWLAELAEGGEALRRQVEPIVQAADQFVRDARRAKASGGPALPFAQRLALAVDAGMRELLPSRKRPRRRPVSPQRPGPHGSTLKIRPPLPFAPAHVDQLAAALTDTLRAAF